MANPRNLFIICLLLLLVVLVWHNSPLLAQSRHRAAKKPRTMLTLTNPVSGIKVIFHDPAFINQPFHDSAWQKLSIYLPGQSKPLTMRAEEGSGYMINSDNEEQWSPDGKYMTVWDTYGILDKDHFSGQRIIFVNLELGSNTGFWTRKGSPVTTDSFRGWVKGKPHVALYASDNPAPNGKEMTEEALDVWK